LSPDEFRAWLEHFPIVLNERSRSENALALCFDEHLYPTGDPVWSDDAQDSLGLSQAGVDRLTRELGDPRPAPTILRSISKWCRGAAAVPVEICVVIWLLGERGDRLARHPDTAKGWDAGASHPLLQPG
jgi:hypothetical protein